ncbi:MAG: Gfo/Idh/MocA family oxidoreductase [Ruminococcaceae bacterium]|nr:Gfo/Idh/MocA family oxidoreductase [Oscillospiraceae bacterium]
MKNLKKCVIVGYGGMGGWHARHILEAGAVELLGVYDIKEERCRAAEENGIHAYASFEEVLADPRVDFITIATPNEWHKPLAIAAMRAGKHVISEKPVTLTVADLEEIIAVSKQTGMLFTAHQNRRWDCDYQMVRTAYHSGKLGRVTAIESRYQGSRGIPGDWRGKKEHGGGMIYDWGVHLIDQMLGIVDDRRVEKVYCRCDHITNDEVDDGFKLDMYFEGGLTARIEVGTTNFISLPRFYIAGVNGTGVVHDWRDECRLVLCRTWEDKDVAPVVTSAGFTKTMAPRDEKTTYEEMIPRPVMDVHDFYRNFAAAIDGKENQIVTHAQLLRSLTVMEAAFRSDELGTPVDIDDALTHDRVI